MLNLKITYNKNKGLVMSPLELKGVYLHGVETKDKNGNPMDMNTIAFFIEAAQNEWEKHLELKLMKQVIEENHTLYRDDFDSWGIIPTTYPVNKAFQLDGYFNNVIQITYDDTWLSSKKTNVSMYDRQINIVPPTKGYAPLMHHAITPYVGMHRIDHFPNYWKLRYITGFESVPKDIANAIGKLASVNVLNILGNTLLGAGISSQSIGIDGLSQSVGIARSTEGHPYGGLVKAYIQDLKDLIEKLRMYYTGIRFTSC